MYVEVEPYDAATTYKFTIQFIWSIESVFKIFTILAYYMTMFFGFHENMQTYKPSKLLLECACKIIYFRYFVIFFTSNILV